ncbi:N/A [soil metagenome]
MYAPFFGLTQEPFSIAPDPRYLFMSERHREALAHLLYGVNGGGGFVLLSGEIGAGKTTVCRCFLEQIPKRCNVAYIFNPKLTVGELLTSVCKEFQVPFQHQGPGVPTVKDCIDPLNEFLLRTHAVGQNNVLIIDEAQMLSVDVLEQLRLLTNLETNERKLLQIVLIGQPELREMLARPELEQLAQRVIARFHLEALSEAETEQYIRHRLEIAGLVGALPFDRGALSRIHQLSRGVPRRINLLCDRAMLGAYATGTTTVGRAIVDKAGGEVFDPGEVAGGLRGAPGRAAWVAMGLVAGAALVGAGVYLKGKPGDVAVASTARAAASGAQGRGPAATRGLGSAGAASVSSAGSAAGALSVPASASSPESASSTLAAVDLKAQFETLTRDEKVAWRELAPVWKLTLPAAGDPCAAAQRQQVYCFKSTASSLALIRQLDRPGILTLSDDDGRAVYALLTGLGTSGATLRMGGVSQTVSLASLSQVWRGDFSTMWRVPAGYKGRVVDGSSGALAEGLAVKLAGLQGDVAAATSPAYSGESLKAQVAAFQLGHGLKPDGLAGPTTFMQLNRATGVAEPRLADE